MLRSMRLLRWSLALLLLLAGPALAAAPVTLLRVDGAIGPASADYLLRGLEHARDEGAQLVVLELDTPRRAGHVDARDHQGDPRQPDPSRHLRHPQWRPGRQRRHLHALRQPCRGDGAGHQPWRGDAGADRWHARRTARAAARQAGRAIQAPRRRHEPQTGQRRRRLYPRPGPVARTQCRVGRAGRARGGQPVGERSAGTEGDRLPGARCCRPAAPARRQNPRHRRG